VLPGLSLKFAHMQFFVAKDRKVEELIFSPSWIQFAHAIFCSLQFARLHFFCSLQFAYVQLFVAQDRKIEEYHH